MHLYATPVAQQQRIARNTLYAIVGVLGAGVVRFLFTIVTGRAFGSDALGAVAIVVAVATIVTIPAAGIGAAGNRYLAVASGQADSKLRANTLGATWRGGIVVIAAAVLVAWGYLEVQSVELSGVTQTLGLAFVASYGLYLTSKGVLFGDGHAGRYATGEVIGFIAFVISITVAAVAAADAGWVLASQVLWTAGVAGAAIAAGVGPTSLSGSAPQQFWSFAGTATVGSLLSLGVTQATVLVMAIQHGTAQAGLLAAAVAITAPLYLLPRGLSLALTPSMSYQVGAGTESIADLDTRFTTTLLVVFGTVAAVSIIAFEGIVLAIYGSDFADATTFVTVFAIASMIAISGIPVVNRFASKGSRSLMVTVVASGIGALGAVVIWFALGPNDPVWIAIGFLVSSVFKVAIPFATSKQVLGQWIVPPSALIVYAIAMVTLALLPDPFPWIALLVSILVAVPVVAFSRIRHRAGLASLRTDQSTLRLGVITNMLPRPDAPHLGIFVADRIAEYQRQGVETIVVGPRRTTGAAKYVRLAFDAAVSLLREPIPDVYEVHAIQPTGIIGRATARTAQRPYVLYAHGADVTSRPRSRWYEQATDRAVADASEIHTNSTYLATEIRSRWHPDGHVVVIPPGVEVPPEPPIDHVRDIDVLYVGNLIARKGVDVLIEALRQLDGPTRAVIAGDGDERDDLEALATRTGVSVEFLGSVPHDEVPQLMARAQVFTAPSRSEPLGQVAVEALAMGTPVVVTDVGGLATIPTPETGSVVAPDDPDALARAIAEWSSLDAAEADAVAVLAHRRARTYALDAVAARSIQRFAAIAAPSQARPLSGAPID